MNCDMLLGVVIGGLIGATVVALNKPAQNTIWKTASIEEITDKNEKLKKCIEIINQNVKTLQDINLKKDLFSYLLILVMCICIICFRTLIAQVISISILIILLLIYKKELVDLFRSVRKDFMKWIKLELWHGLLIIITEQYYRHMLYLKK